MTPEECQKVWNHFGDYIYRVCFQLLKNVDSAADLRQDIFVRLLKSKESLADKAHIRTWLYAVARNCCMDYYRARAFEEERLSMSCAQSVSTLRERSTVVWEFLQHADFEKAVLPPLTCILIKLRFMDGYSLEELAELTNLSPEVVSKRIRRGLEKLR
jgi:RNA polymerase sigma-70 factor (ECF subfamily)